MSIGAMPSLGPELLGVELAQSWAEAIGSLGTAGALLWAVWLFRRSQQMQQADAERQARAVRWVVSREGVELQNASHRVITAISIFVTPEQKPGWVSPARKMARIKAGDQVQLDKSELYSPNEAPFRFQATLFFVDADGRSWAIFNDGVLVATGRSDAPTRIVTDAEYFGDPPLAGFHHAPSSLLDRLGFRARSWERRRTRRR